VGFEETDGSFIVVFGSGCGCGASILDEEVCECRQTFGRDQLVSSKKGGGGNFREGLEYGQGLELGRWTRPKVRRTTSSSTGSGGNGGEFE